MMNTSGNFCHTCGCEFLDKKRKRNITGEFAKIFQAVFNENVSENDAIPRAVCGGCKYQIEKAWRQSEQAKELSIEHLSVLKRKHPVSPLTSSGGDHQTVTRIERKKKGHRLVFESDCPKQMSVTEDTAKESVPVYILPSLPTPNAPVVSACVSGESLSQVKKTQNVATQTTKSNCQCQPSTKKGTCVKVSTANMINVLIKINLHCLQELIEIFILFQPWLLHLH